METILATRPFLSSREAHAEEGTAAGPQIGEPGLARQGVELPRAESLEDRQRPVVPRDAVAEETREQAAGPISGPSAQKVDEDHSAPGQSVRGAQRLEPPRPGDMVEQQGAHDVVE